VIAFGKERGHRVFSKRPARTMDERITR